MYSGWLLTNYSGQILGAHQKFNRVAYRQLKRLEPQLIFPKLRAIQHFEGKNGPDGIKTKSPGRDEPHHFYDPADPQATGLLKVIANHQTGLVKALTSEDWDKAAFEAAWLAHALTDGLTPAHHYPYEQEVNLLRESKIKPTKLRQKLIFKGSGFKDTLDKNWSFWGAQGLFLSHGLFELGVAVLIKPLSLNHGLPSRYDLKLLEEVGLVEVFQRQAQEIADKDMYARFIRRGWTSGLVKDVRQVLAPLITKSVSLAWYGAICQAKAKR